MSDEQDGEWLDEWLDEDEDEAETVCIQCRRYCDPEELSSWKICWMCLDENEEDDRCPGK